jgi:predicted regulator of Ras-like GTPase activity (Roadblock/LC7/MglB family)
MPTFKEELKDILKGVQKFDKELGAIVVEKKGTIVESFLYGGLDAEAVDAIGARAPLLMGAGGKMCTETFQKELEQLYTLTSNGEYVIFNVVKSSPGNIDAILVILALEEVKLGMAFHATKYLLPRLSKLYDKYFRTKTEK